MRALVWKLLYPDSQGVPAVMVAYISPSRFIDGSLHSSSSLMSRIFEVCRCQKLNSFSEYLKLLARSLAAEVMNYSMFDHRVCI